MLKEKVSKSFKRVSFLANFYEDLKPLFENLMKIETFQDLNWNLYKI